MSDKDSITIAAGVLDLAALERPTWPAISAGIRSTGAPTCEGDPDGAGDSEAASGAADGGNEDAADDGGEKDWEAEARKWKALSRKHEGQAKANAAAAGELQRLKDKDKSEAERAADKAANAEGRAATAEAAALRLDVALDQAPDGLSVAQVRKLAKRLAGSTREELEADAAELFAEFAPDTGNDNRGGTRRRPRERLRPGAAPDGDGDDDETDPAKLAAKVPRPY
jgi:hypothetical protein